MSCLLLWYFCKFSTNNKYSFIPSLVRLYISMVLNMIYFSLFLSVLCQKVQWLREYSSSILIRNNTFIVLHWWKSRMFVLLESNFFWKACSLSATTLHVIHICTCLWSSSKTSNIANWCFSGEERTIYDSGN